MRHPYFHRAVQEAFTQFIPSDEQVPYFIFFDVPPAEIDVNIHPTKTEIKFENEQAIWQILLAAIRESIGRFNAIPTIDFDTKGRPADIPVFNPDSTSHPSAPSIHLNPSFNPFTSSSPNPSADGSAADASPHRTPIPRDWQSLYEGATASPSVLPFPSDEGSIDAPLSSLLQYRGQYILMPVDNGLMFIDQHRAHLRILYDHYLAQLSSSNGVTQGLLFPDIIHLAVTDAVTFDAIQTDLHALGFEVSALGGDTFAINGLPAGLEGVDPQRLLLDLLASVAERGSLDTEAIHGRLALTLARAAAIPVGQVLSSLEMQDITNQLFATSSPHYTPDGHSVTALLQQETIEKLFK